MITDCYSDPYIKGLILIAKDYGNNKVRFNINIKIFNSTCMQKLKNDRWDIPSQIHSTAQCLGAVSGLKEKFPVKRPKIGNSSKVIKSKIIIRIKKV